MLCLSSSMEPFWKWCSVVCGGRDFLAERIDCGDPAAWCTFAPLLTLDPSVQGRQHKASSSEDYVAWSELCLFSRFTVLSNKQHFKDCVVFQKAYSPLASLRHQNSCVPLSLSFSRLPLQPSITRGQLAVIPQCQSLCTTGLFFSPALWTQRWSSHYFGWEGKKNCLGRACSKPLQEQCT